jgi:uncharacterized damage-inducible protein DinB
MADDFRDEYLRDAWSCFDAIKAYSEKALQQVDDEQYFAALDAESNSLAVLVKHMAGNMRSRWSDFLTADGEKPDRDRDREFEISDRDTRESLTAAWEQAWERLFASLGGLTPEDLDRTVKIRGEPHSIAKAISRQIFHLSQHAGQIVFLAKHLRSAQWQTLTIPRGQTRQFNERMARKWGPHEE